MSSHSPISTATRVPVVPDLTLEKGASELVAVITARAVRTFIAAAWAGPRSRGSEKASPLAPHLFDGTLGIAFLLAAWSKIAHCVDSRELAMAALFPLRKKLNLLIEDEEAVARIQYLGGGFIGFGSFLYGLSTVSLLLDEPEPARDAVAVAQKLVTCDRIARQADNDLIDGVSGLLPALDAVRRAAVRFDLDFDFLTPGKACGASLRRLAEKDFRGMRSGFGHGLSGVAYSLLRLHTVDPTDEWIDLAHRAFTAERNLYNPDQRAWIHPTTGSPNEQNAWCHGASGMLLARADARSRGLYPDDPVAAADLETCLQATENQPDRPRDHLCCGKLGLALILDHAGAGLDRPLMTAAARHLGREVAHRCPDQLVAQGSEGEFDEEWIDPSLMNGLAGVGYALLCLSRPELPNILLLQ